MTKGRNVSRRISSGAVILRSAALAGLVALMTGCLVDDRYCVYANGDCPVGQRCDAQSHSCQLEECQQDSHCWLNGFPNGKSCIAGRCEFALTTGKRVDAPAFCLEVANPKSPYQGQSRCLADEKGKVVLVFFALLA